jgi:hypothetical protein
MARRRVWLVVAAGLAAAGALAGGALGFLTVSTTGGSAGGAAGGSVGRVPGLALGSGAVTPSASAGVPLRWNGATLGNGGAVTGYVVHRYDSAGSLQSTGAGCSGVVSSTTCTETSVPDGTWTYGVQATLATWVGAESARITVTVDTSAPLITSTPSSVSANTSPSFGFADSSYTSFRCKVDTGSFTACSSPYAAGPLTDGSHTFRVEALDAANVPTQLASYTWTVAAGAPTISARPAGPSANSNPAFAFTHGSYTSFDCSLDGAAFTACASPRSYSALGDGVHTFQVRARSADGAATAAASYNWTIATGAPTITARPSGPSADSNPAFAFTHGSYASFDCSLDGAAFTACTSPRSYSAVGDGAHTFQVRARSADGAATTAASYTWTVDTSAPTITANPTTPSANTTPTFSFGHTSVAYTFKCQIDAGGFSACSSPHTLAALGDGAHTFQVEGVDGDGAATAVASYSWTVNTTAPTLTAQPASTTNQTTATFTFSHGTYSRFTCKLDSGTAAACNGGTVTYGALAAGSHTFTVFADDADGVVTQSRVYSWTIDTTPPALQTLQMLDTDHDGKVDHVVATFDKTLGSCTAPCTSGWTLANVPSGGTLSSATISGATATLNLTEGAGAANTAVGSFTVSLSSTSGVVDTLGNHSSFAAQVPADKASPVPVAVTLANGNGTIAPGDTASVTFSEPLAVATVCSSWSGNSSNQTLGGNGNVTVTVTDNGPSNDSLSSVTATSGCGGVVHFGTVNLGSTGWLTTTNTFGGNGGNMSQLDWTVATSTLKVTLGKASGAVGTVAGSVAATYTPDAAITDPAGNAVAGSVTATTKF